MIHQRANGGEMRSIEVLQVGAEVSEGGVTVVNVAGEVDVYSAPQVANAVEEALSCPVKKIVVEMSGVSFIDTCGIESLIQLCRQARRRGVAFAIRQPSEAIIRMKQLMNVDGLLLPVDAY